MKIKICRWVLVPLLIFFVFTETGYITSFCLLLIFAVLESLAYDIEFNRRSIKTILRGNPPK